MKHETDGTRADRVGQVQITLIRYWLQRIHRLALRLFNCNAVALPATAQG